MKSWFVGLNVCVRQNLQWSCHHAVNSSVVVARQSLLVSNYTCNELCFAVQCLNLPSLFTYASTYQSRQTALSTGCQCLSLGPSGFPAVNVCLSDRLAVRLSGCLSLGPSGCLSLGPSGCLAVRLSVSRTVWLSGCLAVRLSVSRTVWLSGCLSLGPSGCPAVRLSVSRTVWLSGCRMQCRQQQLILFSETTLMLEIVIVFLSLIHI